MKINNQLLITILGHHFRYRTAAEKVARMITLGDHIDAIIINDYNSRPPLNEGERPDVPNNQHFPNLLTQITSTCATTGQSLPSHSKASHIYTDIHCQSSTHQTMSRTSSAWDSLVGSSSDPQRPRPFSGPPHPTGSQGAPQGGPQSSSGHHDMPQNWRKRAVQQQALNEAERLANHQQQQQQSSPLPPHSSASSTQNYTISSAPHSSSSSSSSSSHPPMEVDSLKVPTERSGLAGRVTPELLRSRSPQASASASAQAPSREGGGGGGGEIGGSQAADSSGASVLAKVRTQTGPPQMEPTLSDFMNAKIEMTMREEEDEERQQAMGSDSAYPSPSSSGTTRLPGQGSGSSSRSCGEVASSAHEGAVSSTAASSEAADQEGEGGVGGGEGESNPPTHPLPPRTSPPPTLPLPRASWGGGWVGVR
ncbi:hypothetical protein ACOMHN_040274 [Nucella lapillus]